MTESSNDIVQIRGLSTHFPVRGGIFKRVIGHVKAVDGVDLDIHRGEVLGLVGESGCGKTTLGKTLLQLVPSTSGAVEYVDKEDLSTSVDLCNLTKEQLQPYRQKLQIVFQDPHSSLNPAFTVFGSLEDPLKQMGINTRRQRRRIVGDLLESVNLRREYMDRYPNEFSGGQRQRIGIARALSVNPDLIVCDEAVSALDVSIQAQVLELLVDLKKRHNLTYLFITHDLSVAEYLCDRIAVMYLGRIVELARSEELFEHKLHPYTEALLSAVPVADLKRRTHRIILQGDVPSPMNPPSGCAFHPRCSKAVDICSKEVPVLMPHQIGGRTHHVACHLISTTMP